MVQNILLIGCLPKLSQRDDSVISFTKEDVWRVHHPHDDELVINLTIVDFNTRRVLMDNESSANILYYPAFQ